MFEWFKKLFKREKDKNEMHQEAMAAQRQADAKAKGTEVVEAAAVKRDAAKRATGKKK